MASGSEVIPEPVEVKPSTIVLFNLLSTRGIFDAGIISQLQIIYSYLTNKDFPAAESTYVKYFKILLKTPIDNANTLQSIIDEMKKVPDQPKQDPLINDETGTIYDQLFVEYNDGMSGAGGGAAVSGGPLLKGFNVFKTNLLKLVVNLLEIRQGSEEEKIIYETIDTNINDPAKITNELMNEVLGRIRDVINKAPVTKSSRTTLKKYKILATEMPDGKIKIHATKGEDADFQNTEGWLQVDPSIYPANYLANTLRLRKDEINNDFKFLKSPLNHYSMSKGIDPVLGKYWREDRRSPVFIIPVEIFEEGDKKTPPPTPAINIPIFYYDRNIGSEGKVNLYKNSNKGDNVNAELANPTPMSDRVIRLDNFVMNVIEILKIKLKPEDPVYVLSYGNPKDIGQDFQFTQISLTPGVYAPGNPEHRHDHFDIKDSNNKLFTGALYAPAVKKMFDDIKGEPSAKKGGGRKSRRYRMPRNRTKRR